MGHFTSPAPRYHSGHPPLIKGGVGGYHSYNLQIFVINSTNVFTS